MPEQVDIDKKRKRTLFILCASIIFAAFLVLTIVNYYENDRPEIILDLLVMSSMAGCLIAIVKWNKDMIVYRATHFLVSLLLFYGVAFGTGRETVLYWVVMMPLICFYFLGKREGLLWAAIFSACIIGIMLATTLTGIHIYSPDLLPRYPLILFIAIMIGYALEASRDTYSRLLREKNKALQHEKELLEKAASDIKTLSGLIPICCHCKKIRNDEGYWQQVEIYVHERTHADFSHGICPECFEKLYPQFRQSSAGQKRNSGDPASDISPRQEPKI